MNKERLEKLANYLDTLDPSKDCIFDMSTWTNSVSCGFAGCAIGWAIHSKLFKKDGLQWADQQPCYYKDGKIVGFGFDAVERFFGLSETKALELFSDMSYEECSVEPEDVAARIRKVIANAS